MNSFINSIASDIFGELFIIGVDHTIISFNEIVSYITPIFKDWTTYEINNRPVNIDDLFYCIENDLLSE